MPFPSHHSPRPSFSSLRQFLVILEPPASAPFPKRYATLHDQSSVHRSASASDTTDSLGTNPRSFPHYFDVLLFRFYAAFVKRLYFDTLMGSGEWRACSLESYSSLHAWLRLQHCAAFQRWNRPLPALSAIRWDYSPTLWAVSYLGLTA